MILQALVRHYEDLTAQNLIASPGWNQVKVSYALELDEQGTLLRAASIQEAVTKGKKTVLAPRLMELPAPVKRTVGIAANFLCDNASYILGFDGKGNPERARECFAACKTLHEQLLSGVNAPAAKALLAFFRCWDPEQAAGHPAIQDEINGVLAGANLVFRFHGAFIHEDPSVRQAWQAHYDTDTGGSKMICLVTGQETSVEAVHPAIKGVQGAQSSGAALVSFNAPAFCSYGKEQNFNAPTGKYAAFAYTSALNHLLADREHLFRLGDTTVVCWAEGGEPAFQDAFGAFTFGAQCSYTETELRSMVEKLLRGSPVLFDETLLDPDRPFYILGLAPNAARLSVRFFLRNSFGGFLENVRQHYDRLNIVKPAYDKFDTLPLWKLLGETVNQNAKDKAASPNMTGAVLRSVLMNEPYPATLLHGALLRIRAEREITRGRAAILKAYYLKRAHPDIPKEVLTVSLNPDSTNIPYTLGRLFSVLEAVQSSANPGINATIKDRYFNAASSTPGHIFPILLNLSQKHMRKLEGGLRVYYEKQITQLTGVLSETFPPRLNLPQQGAFQLGYYHQTQKRYEKKEENDNA
ncbi:MAG: type I-C CRISPR-associated protein Cas8c/Csd1 [Oscillospiraceae bacterium]|nr:type I-C CRISPR-associated protein Cas8c/Csd1 [Oscillospiraceae bacterium]